MRVIGVLKMSELDLGLVTSVITFICLFLFGFVTGDTIGRNEVVGFAGAIAGIIVWYYNEKHNSDLISGDVPVTTGSVIDESEEDLINQDYYEEEN